MSENRRDDLDRDADEKDRIGEEKELEKHDEKEEKSVEEKSRQDPVGSMVWACTLIWAGVVLLASNFGWSPRFSLRWGEHEYGIRVENLDDVVGGGAWQLFFIGAGILVLVGIVVRLLVPEYRRPVLGNLIWAIVLFGIALGQWDLIWPLILIAIGLSILFGRAARRRRSGSDDQ